MDFSLGTTFIVLLFVNGVKLMPTDFENKDEDRIEENQQRKHACYNKIVSSKGYIQSPHIAAQSMTCEWDIDVTRGFVVELEFEVFRLPINSKRICDSYIEIIYGSKNDPNKRIYCADDKVDIVATDSQTVLIRYHTGIYQNDQDYYHYGFKINYIAIPALKSTALGNNAVLILLLTVAVILILALCAFFFRCHPRRHRNWGMPRNTIVNEAPNAPNREQLQSAFERERLAIQIPIQDQRKQPDFPIFQSQSSSVHSNLNKWTSMSNLPAAAAASDVAPTKPEKPISYTATPLSVFPELRRKWSEGSVQRIEHLRTKLVARFSSVSSQNMSDISVFIPTSGRDSERGSYSQLSCVDEMELQKIGEDGKNETRLSTHSTCVPSIVIEFVK